MPTNPASSMCSCYRLKRGFITSDIANSLIKSDLATYSSLKVIAATLQVNKETLRKRYRSETGEPISRYIRRAQLSLMKKLLVETDLTCQDIAKKCGFRRAESACRFFHRETGVTMMSYRLLNRPQMSTANDNRNR